MHSESLHGAERLTWCSRRAGCCDPAGEGAHSHAHSDHANKRRLLLVLALTAGYTAVEAVGGWLTGSLALLADAGHMLSDDLSLGLALFAAWAAARPPSPRRTYGFKRAEVLAALVNGVTLVAISIWIFVEAYHRFREPPQILGGWMLAVAVVGMAVNVAGALLLHAGHEHDLNLSAAFRHLLADLLGSVGAVAAAVIVLLTGWAYADPLISVAIGLLVLASSWGVLRQSANVLLEATPEGISAEDVHARMLAQEGVVSVHDLHVWTVTSGFPALTAHVLVRPAEDPYARRRQVEQVLAREFGITHTTLQVDEAPP